MESPQGSVLGPLLFMLFVNDLEYGLGGRVYKFADDTKLVRTVNAPEDCIGMQRDLDKLVGWARRWRMSYNVSKCQVMHFGGRNPCFSYDLEGVWLSESSVERDLGVLVSTDLKCGAQCLAARNRANGVLGYINRLVGYKSREVIVKLYSAFVRPHLEYALPALAPHYRKDVDMLERVQRRATRLIPGLRGLSYSDRLDTLGMYSLERRQLKGDLIELFKIFAGITKLNVEELFTLSGPSGTSLRGHSRKLFKESSRLDIRKHFFTHRVVKYWNCLPECVVMSESVGKFKRGLDSFMDSRGG